MKVLIVEDDVAIRSMMEKTINRAGYETQSAVDGEQGLKLFKEFKPEVVLSDINMPVMTGLELLERIRSNDADVLFIIFSTLDSPEFILQALRLKANDYLIKPVPGRVVTALLDKYATIINGRTKKREVLGMIYSLTLGMKIGNDLDLVSKVVDQLMVETEKNIGPAHRFGIHLGLVEMLTNSIEHGNLDISYEEKTAAMAGTVEQWREFLRLRYENPLYAHRLVNLKFKLDKDRCEWLLTDQGKGFDWKNIPDPAKLENLLEAHGRGILLSSMQFDEITYLGNGNQVRLVKHLTAPT
ncbi:MAG: response regulator [Candidatus Riflebacteria bacterium]|nr:response regulator [Candidatus Riflebacteria bacterium]